MKIIKHDQDDQNDQDEEDDPVRAEDAAPDKKKWAPPSYSVFSYSFYTAAKQSFRDTLTPPSPFTDFKNANYISIQNCLLFEKFSNF